MQVLSVENHIGLMISIAPPPVVTAIQFSDSATSIVLSFNMDTNRANMIGESDCSLIISNTDVLGEGKTNVDI